MLRTLKRRMGNFLNKMLSPQLQSNPSPQIEDCYALLRLLTNLMLWNAIEILETYLM